MLAEMATSVDDILTRRTRARLIDRRASLAAAPAVADLIAAHLGWTSAQRDASLAEFIEECAHEDTAALVEEKELW